MQMKKCNISNVISKLMHSFIPWTFCSGTADTCCWYRVMCSVVICSVSLYIVLHSDILWPDRLMKVGDFCSTFIGSTILSDGSVLHYFNCWSRAAHYPNSISTEKYIDDDCWLIHYITIPALMAVTIWYLPFDDYYDDICYYRLAEGGNYWLQFYYLATSVLLWPDCRVILLLFPLFYSEEIWRDGDCCGIRYSMMLFLMTVFIIQYSKWSDIDDISEQWRRRVLCALWAFPAEQYSEGLSLCGWAFWTYIHSILTSITHYWYIGACWCLCGSDIIKYTSIFYSNQYSDSWYWYHSDWKLPNSDYSLTAFREEGRTSEITVTHYHCSTFDLLLFQWPVVGRRRYLC